MDWEANARRVLDFYLEDIRHACQARGVDPDPIVANVEAEIEATLARRGTFLVRTEEIEALLAAEGSPDSKVPDSDGFVETEGVAFSAVPAPVPPPLPPSLPPSRPVPVGPSGLAAHVSQGRTTARASSNRGCMIGSLVMVGIGLAFFVFIGVMGYYQAQKTFGMDQEACNAQMTQLGELLAAHVDPETGEYPPLAPEGHPFLFGGAARDEVDVTLLRCANSWFEHETDESILASPDYIYLGYAIRNQAELDAYLEAYAAKDGDMAALMAEPVMGPDGVLPRLRADLPDSANIPILVERSNYHFVGGSSVLFLDGHVEFLETDSRFPVTWEFFGAFGRVEGEMARAGCHKNLEALGAFLVAQAESNGGQFPAVLTESPAFIFGGTALEEVSIELLRCPMSKYMVNTKEGIRETPSYYYLGYAVSNQNEMDAYMAAIAILAKAGETQVDVEALGDQAVILPRLSLALAEPEKIPLLVEISAYQHEDGAHVLYLDGHVEWIATGDSFPMTDEFFTTMGTLTELDDREKCMANLAALSTLLSKHANANDGAYPGLAPDQEPFIFGGQAFEELDATLLRCPSYAYEEEAAEDILYDADYIYLGFAVRNQAEMDAYMQAYMEAEGDVEVLNALDTLEGPDGDIPRLRSDLPNPETIPVIIEWNLHEPDGGHVLYLDGHVEFVSMEEAFPMTEDFFDSADLVYDLDYPIMEELWDVFWTEFWRGMRGG